jgi:hypothetical protein
MADENSQEQKKTSPEKDEEKGSSYFKQVSDSYSKTKESIKSAALNPFGTTVNMIDKLLDSMEGFSAQAIKDNADPNRTAPDPHETAREIAQERADQKIRNQENQQAQLNTVTASNTPKESLIKTFDSILQQAILSAVISPEAGKTSNQDLAKTSLEEGMQRNLAANQAGFRIGSNTKDENVIKKVSAAGAIIAAESFLVAISAGKSPQDAYKEAITSTTDAINSSKISEKNNISIKQTGKEIAIGVAAGTIEGMVQNAGGLVALKDSARKFVETNISQLNQAILKSLKEGQEYVHDAIKKSNSPTLIKMAETVENAAQDIEKIGKVGYNLATSNTTKMATRLAVAATLTGGHGIATAAVAVGIDMAAGGMQQSRRENLLSTEEYLEKIMDSRAKTAEILNKNPNFALLVAPPKLNTDVSFKDVELADHRTPLQKTIGIENTKAIESVLVAIAKSGDIQTVVENTALKAAEIFSNLSQVPSLYSALSQIKETDKTRERENGANINSTKTMMRKYIHYCAKIVELDKPEISDSRKQQYELANQSLEEQSQTRALEKLSEKKEFQEKLQQYNQATAADKNYFDLKHAIEAEFLTEKTKAREEIIKESAESRYNEDRIKKSENEHKAAITRVASGTVKFLSSSEQKDYDDLLRKAQKEDKTIKSFEDLGNQQKKKAITANEFIEKTRAELVTEATDKIKPAHDKETQRQLDDCKASFNEKLAKIDKEKETNLTNIKSEHNANIKQLESQKNEAINKSSTTLEKNKKNLLDESSAKLNSVKEKELEKIKNESTKLRQETEKKYDNQYAQKKDIIVNNKNKEKEEFVDTALRKLAVELGKNNNLNNIEAFKKNAKEAIEKMEIKTDDPLKNALKASLTSDKFLETFHKTISEKATETKTLQSDVKLNQIGKDAIQTQKTKINILDGHNTLVKKQTELLCSYLEKKDNKEVTVLAQVSSTINKELVEIKNEEIKKTSEVNNKTQEQINNLSKSLDPEFKKFENQHEANVKKANDEFAQKSTSVQNTYQAKIEKIENNHKTQSETSSNDFAKKENEIKEERAKDLNKAIEKETAKKEFHQQVEQISFKNSVDPKELLKIVDKAKNIEQNENEEKKSNEILIEVAKKCNWSKDNTQPELEKIATALKVSEEIIKSGIASKVRRNSLQDSFEKNIENISKAENFAALDKQLNEIKEQNKKTMGENSQEYKQWVNETAKKIDDKVLEALKTNAGNKKNLHKLITETRAKLTNDKSADVKWEELKNTARKELLDNLKTSVNNMNKSTKDIEEFKETLQKIATTNANLSILERENKNIFKSAYNKLFNKDFARVKNESDKQKAEIALTRKDLAKTIEACTEEYYVKNVKDNTLEKQKSFENTKAFLNAVELFKKVKTANKSAELHADNFIQKLKRGSGLTVLTRVVKNAAQKQANENNQKIEVDTKSTITELKNRIKLNVDSIQEKVEKNINSAPNISAPNNKAHSENRGR